MQNSMIQIEIEYTEDTKQTLRQGQIIYVCSLYLMGSTWLDQQ